MPAKPAVEPIEHFLVPKHVMLSKEQAAMFLKKYNLRMEQLPKILSKDPSIADLNVERNEIVKIVRDSPTAGKTTYYRRVW